jgi:two-component system cell cycle response regulator
VSAPRVLIADDSPLVLRMIEKMLEGAGFSVLTARDGLEAIEKAFAEDVSLVILDVMMPRMTGYQACRLLKTEPSTKAIPVVILTSKDQPRDRFWDVETGADYYVTKDAQPQRILELVKNVLAGEAARVRARRSDGPRASVDILSRVNELLDRKLYEATVLSEIGGVARSLVQFDETFTSVMGLVARVVDFSIGAMAFVHNHELEMLLMLNRPCTPAVVDEAKARLAEAVSRYRPGAPVGRVQDRVFTPPGGGAGGAEETTLQGFTAFPVVTNLTLSSLLGLSGRAVARLEPETNAFLGQIANQAHIVLENARLFDRIKNMAIRDSLTDLFNHRHSVELVTSEFQRVGRYAAAVSLLMIDVDHFKAVNDEHGHPAGDAVLRELSRLLKEQVRTVDSIGRYGGEEFVVLLPHTPTDEAHQTADRLRRSVDTHAFRDGEKVLHVTVSVGVATYPGDGIASAEDLIREADKALYRAKQSGRNQVA